MGIAMYAFTYQAEEMNLLPAVKNARVEFNGDIDLNARPDGTWTIESIWLDVATPGPRFTTINTKHKLLAGDVLYEMVVKAAEAHDRATHAISDHVNDEIADADRAAYNDHQHQLGKDIARGLEVR
ncbi:MAG TPA: hypothetical protein VGN82_14410 [Bosea sp. (in: a-proteobacteria)]|jgi:hypothetical protein|uniref:hypothetical protein n=1 Tax=Bosea sp. (in: a-proteobacteria) TaxID=1871050 RepID=UPI002E15057D|nr:hypothetical protein [Bosea sp. (in: a-proteobacteria)]